MVRETQHICQLHDFDLRKSYNYVPEGPKKYYEKLFYVSDNAMKYTVCFKTENSLILEKIRQRNFPFVIHAFSPFIFYWECFMTLVYFFSFFFIPFEACNVFLRQMNPKIQMNFGIIMVVLHSIFLVDIVINFFTGYLEWRMKKVILNRRAIALKYLKTYFFPDLLSTVPALMNAVPFYFGNGDVICRRMIILNFLKLSRLMSYTKYFSRIAYRYDFNNLVFLILRFLLRSVFFFHWASCLLFVLPFIITTEPITVFSSNIWIHRIKSNISRLTGLNYYRASFFYTVNLMLSCAAMKKAETVNELVVNLLFVVLGIMYNCFLFIRLLHIIRSLMEPETKYDEFITQLQDYMRHNQLPTNLQQRLYNFFEHRYQRVYFREDAILKTLSEKIFEDINVYARRRMVKQDKILSNLSKEVQEELIPQFTLKLYLPKDVIVKAHTKGKHIYFLASGTVAAYTVSGKEICHFYDGNYFGETSIFLKDQEMIANTYAIEMCEIYLLEKDVFLRAVSTNPAVQEIVMQQAMQKIKMTRAIEAFKSRSRMEEDHSSYI